MAPKLSFAGRDNDFVLFCSTILLFIKRIANIIVNLYL